MTHNRAIALARLLQEKDVNDLLYLRFTGEGSSGEDLIEVLEQITDQELEWTRDRQGESPSDIDGLELT